MSFRCQSFSWRILGSRSAGGNNAFKKIEVLREYLIPFEPVGCLDSVFHQPSTKGWVAQDAGRGAGFRVTGGTATVTFDRLSGDAYVVEVAASNRTNFSNSVADIAVNGSFADADEGGTGENGDDYPLDGNGHNNWLIWNAVPPSAGQIEVSMTFASGANGTVINAIRLVPEPGFASLLVGGLSALILLARLRRR